jgi:hypothetical protein
MGNKQTGSERERKTGVGIFDFFVYFAGQHDEPLLKEARADHTQKVLFRHCRSCINSSIFLFVFLFCRRGGGRCSRGIGVGFWGLGLALVDRWR